MIRICIITFFSLLIVNCSPDSNKELTKVIVLGMDGLDPVLLKRFMEKGELANFEILASNGSFMELGTSYPPQSPVAWSNFITGNNPGKHGIFDFIHREPESYTPFLSTSKKIEGRLRINIGGWSFPLIPPRIVNQRKGTPFWRYLEKEGIPSYLIKIPSTFPPDGGKSYIISGLGTPDILGTNGIFSFYTDKKYTGLEETEDYRVYPVVIVDNTVNSYIYGPHNPLKRDSEVLKERFSIFLSEDTASVIIKVENEEFYLKKGDWSDWIEIKFDVLPPFYSISSICRFYLQDTRPYLKLYISPLNINPAHPVIPISSPKGFSSILSRDIGFFYTQGMPVDSKVLRSGIFNRYEYLRQMEIVWNERKKLYKWALKRFKFGVLFFYFTTPDVNQHLFWSAFDTLHPSFRDDIRKDFGDVVLNTYKRMDSILNMTMENADDNTLVIVISDHGFSPFIRSFNVNSWLYRMGYLNLLDERKIGFSDIFRNIDWSRTKAYSLGFNSLYLNLKGREGSGIVSENEKDSLLRKISEEIENTIDPETGKFPVYRAYTGGEIYNGDCKKYAPDICIGYRRGYRTSWQSALGVVTDSIFYDNDDMWSGTHLISPEVIPGIILTNRKIRLSDPDLRDIPFTVLKEFGIIADMEGKNIFKEN